MPGKTTVACTHEQYETLITTIFNGVYDANIRPNPRIATALELQANTGLRIGDILSLRMSNILKDGERYRFNMIEEKTGKKRTFTIPTAVYDFLHEYVEKCQIRDNEIIFPLSERAIQKHLKKVCDYLGPAYSNISSHSFRKYFGTSIYYANGCDLELVRRLFQHSSAVVTARYLGISDQKIDEALQNHVKLVTFEKYGDWNSKQPD